MKQIRVTNIQHGCVNDGPGVRTTVFLKGCPLKCPWCCNPETQSYEEQYYVNEEKCLLKNGVFSALCEHCERNGGIVTLCNCPLGVYESVSRDYTSEQLFQEIEKDCYLYETSGGGVTFSGGEPLLQAKEIEPVFKQLKENNIPIAFETTLIAPEECIRTVKDYVDYWIVDLKLQPEMMLRDKEYIHNLHSTVDIIKNGGKIEYRLVYVDSMLNRHEEVAESLLMLGVMQIELLQAHNLGQKKYKKLNRTCKDYTSSLDGMRDFALNLNTRSIKTKISTI